MAAPASTSILDLVSAPKSGASKKSSTAPDPLNSMTGKNKSFSEVYNDRVNDTADRASEKSSQASSKASSRNHADRQDDKREVSRNDEASSSEVSDSGDSLPVKKASTEAGSAEGKDGHETDSKQDLEQTDADNVQQINVQQIVDISATGSSAEQATTDAAAPTEDELIEFIAGLAASTSAKGEGKIDGLTEGDDPRAELAKVLQSVLQNQKGSGDSKDAAKASDNGKGAEVSQILKDLIGKVSAEGATEGKSKATDQQGLDAVLSKLADGAQIKLPAQSAVSGQMAVQMSVGRNDAAASGPYITTIQQSIQHPEWKDGMANKVTWMVSQNIQSAKIHLNPAELGPIEMKIQVHKDQAHIQVHSQHAVTRDLMEGTVHRLREMLADQGIELSQFDVSSQQGQQFGSESGEGQSEGGSDISLADGQAGEESARTVEQTLELDQLVDYYV
ncbi:hypothetical protein BTA51_12995 [Hahella sp. CCB-MM4]|uniref:flagellar hook-length control protein FliK n=1 Tax=Hahella sp. (strain CCB-MM4) TaxID=1926491 RepID=UPI000B9C528F|nr:flagellar hook-length control protein FliK [Hahella sp. CCB-MM4]OZG72884.1 hypothetical protein BTA51_12995 [Hahella sp. CCB-MM4]